jgi:hypothetical protein
MKPEQKKEQELSPEDLQQTSGGIHPIVRADTELSTTELHKVSGGAKKAPAKIIDETESE